MADLSEVIAGAGTVAAIDRHYETNREQRRRLGLSQAGHPCMRRLWYTHHGYDEASIEGRILRLFELGNILEDEVVADLNDIGVQVYWQQHPVKIEMEGITLTGHIDGVIRGLLEAPETPHIFECKTASRKSFEKLVKYGSYREWNEQYFWQVQFYMLGLGFKRAAVFVYCKDDSRLYMERIPLDKDATVDRLQDVFFAIGMDDSPCRLCESENEFEARFCPFKEECFGSQTN